MSEAVATEPWHLAGVPQYHSLCKQNLVSVHTRLILTLCQEQSTVTLEFCLRISPSTYLNLSCYKKSKAFVHFF